MTAPVPPSPKGRQRDRGIGPLAARIAGREILTSDGIRVGPPGGRPSGQAPVRTGTTVAFRTRLTVALIAAAVVPLAAFGVVLAFIEPPIPGPVDTVPRLIILSIALAVLIAVLVAYVLVASLTRPLREIAHAVDRVNAGDLSTPISIPGDDELARLAESHNRLAADLDRRNGQLHRILAAILQTSPQETVDRLIARTEADAREAFGMIDAAIMLNSVPHPNRGVRAR